jgi:hypothetical protein
MTEQNYDPLRTAQANHNLTSQNRDQLGADKTHGV